MFRLQPVGVAAVVLGTNINKVCTHLFYQSTISLLVTHFTYLEGRNGELVVHLAAVDSHGNRASSYVFKRPYSWEEVPLFNSE